MTLEIDTGFVEHNGGCLYWEAAGTGSPVILVHGNTLDTRMWNDQFPILAAEHRVVRYDLRGFGRSSVPNGPYGAHEDLESLLDGLGLDRVALVGLSLGVGVVTEFAAYRPERVDRLVALDGNAGGPSPEMLRLNETLGRVARESGLATAKELWLNSDLFAAAMEQPQVAARLRTMVEDWSGWRWLEADPRVLLDPSARMRIRELEMPMLCIVGERDLQHFRESTQELAALAMHGSYLEVPSAGHMSNMEQPDVVNRALREFLWAPQ